MEEKLIERLGKHEDGIIKAAAMKKVLIAMGDHC